MASSPVTSHSMSCVALPPSCTLIVIPNASFEVQYVCDVFISVIRNSLCVCIVSHLLCLTTL